MSFDLQRAAKLALIAVASATLAACASKKPPPPPAPPPPPPAPPYVPPPPPPPPPAPVPTTMQTVPAAAAPTAPSGGDKAAETAPSGDELPEPATLEDEGMLDEVGTYQTAKGLVQYWVNYFVNYFFGYVVPRPSPLVQHTSVVLQPFSSLTGAFLQLRPLPARQSRSWPLDIAASWTRSTGIALTPSLKR